jgi:glyoxylase-like metal-dependent hydrolase (beta-lactamase superfamily II)
MERRVAAWVVTCAWLAAPLFAGSAASSYQEARRVLDAGLRAIGGIEALREIKDIAREGGGTSYAQGQSLVPDGPLLARTIESRTFQDFAGNRGATLTATTGAGTLPTKVRTVATDAGFSHNMITKLTTPMAQGALANARTNLRRDPAVLLLLANERAETLRSLGEDTFDGRRHQLVTFAAGDGAQLTLAFDAATGLLSRVQTLSDNAVLGDTLTETVLSDYRDVAVGSRSVKLAHRTTTVVAGETTQDVRFSRIAVNGGPPTGLLDPPEGAETVPAAPPGSGVTLTKLGEDVYLAGGGSHHSLVVVFADHVVVVEAPLGEERSLAVLAKIAETAPGKPVRYLAPTHYHSDHTGGLRTYIAKGVTIVTTPGNRGFVERLARATKTIRPDLLAREPRAPVVETFTGRRVFSDATRTLELRDVGPNPHVTEAVVAYLPKQKAVFVADLFTIPLAGPFPPASPALASFAEAIQKQGLAVETIAPAHGRLGTLADLTAALAVKMPAID